MYYQGFKIVFKVFIITVIYHFNTIAKTKYTLDYHLQFRIQLFTIELRRNLGLLIIQQTKI